MDDYGFMIFIRIRALTGPDGKCLSLSDFQAPDVLVFKRV